MWSVVVLPLVLIRTGMSTKSLPSQADHGSISCSRSLLGSTCNWMLPPSSGGATYVACPRSKSLAGTSGAGLGGSRRNALPSASVKVSVRGLKDSRLASAKAVTISGLPMKFIVVGEPSLRRGKLRLYEVTMVLGAASAAAAQGGRDFVDKTVARIGHFGGEPGNRAGPVRGMRADDVGLQLGQVELDHPVVIFRWVGLDLFVRLEQMLVLLHQRNQGGFARRPQIFGHALVSREERRRGSELGPHIGDRRLAGSADRPCAGADVFDDRVCGAGNSQLPRDIENDILGGGPPAHLAGQIDRNVPRVEHLPRQPGDDLDGVGAADPHRAGSETAGVGCVRVGADDQLAGERIVLQHNL